MAQFRLTQRFARDLKVEAKNPPDKDLDPLDDWAIDLFRLGRRKVALISHVQTLLSFLLPYELCGGAKELFYFLPLTIENYLREHQFLDWIDPLKNVLSTPSHFTKTEHRKLLGHMNDFKRITGFYRSYEMEKINWSRFSEDLNNTPVGPSYKTPKQLLQELLKR